MIETFVDEQGRVIDRQVMPDEQRELMVAKVVSLSPPSVKIKGRSQPVPIAARLSGVTVQVDDFVLICRVEQGVIAIGKVEVL